MLHVYSHDKHVAMINLQPKGADTFNPAEPWLLLHNTGRIDRFATMKEARGEARKTYSRCEFRKT
jgi:hypothetical protein